MLTHSPSKKDYNHRGWSCKCLLLNVAFAIMSKPTEATRNSHGQTKSSDSHIWLTKVFRPQHFLSDCAFADWDLEGWCFQTWESVQDSRLAVRWCRQEVQEQVMGGLRNKLKEGRQNLGIRKASGIYALMMMKLRWECTWRRRDTGDNSRDVRETRFGLDGI